MFSFFKHDSGNRYVILDELKRIDRPGVRIFDVSTRHNAAFSYTRYETRRGKVIAATETTLTGNQLSDKPLPEMVGARARPAWRRPWILVVKNQDQQPNNP